MPGVARVLLVHDDAEAQASLRGTLAREGSIRVETASSGGAGLIAARAFEPDVIISDHRMPGLDGLELCRVIKADPVLAQCIFMLLTASPDASLKVKGFNLGVDDYLIRPIEAAELRARVRSRIRLKRLHDQLRESSLAVQHKHLQLERSLQQLLSLLMYLLDGIRPGAGNRGQRLATLVLDLAERFSIPSDQRRDLELAALLHEVGLAQRQVGSGHPGSPGSLPPDDFAGGADLLERVGGLAGAAELLRGASENWDGSGGPSRLRQGQIPFCARLLRAAMDFLALLENRAGVAEVETGAAQALLALRKNSGVVYDPLVLVQLGSHLLESSRVRRRAASLRYGTQRDKVDEAPSSRRR